MRLLKGNTLYCFSPPVMIATFLIEIFGAIWTIWRYRLDRVSRLVAAILVFLGIFQLAEFSICEGAFGLTATIWARIGFVSITMLPPLGIHLARNLAGARQRVVDGIVAFGYLAAACFIVYFLTTPGFTSGKCLGNYVIFAVSHLVTPIYALYYYGLLIVGVALCLYLARSAKKATSKKALHGLAMGYLLFMIPTTAANLVAPETIAAIPSVMCGFAVLLALVLLAVVLPSHYQGERRKQQRSSSMKVS